MLRFFYSLVLTMVFVYVYVNANRFERSNARPTPFIHRQGAYEGQMPLSMRRKKSHSAAASVLKFQKIQPAAWLELTSIWALM
jgi:hypothetical protein